MAKLTKTELLNLISTVYDENLSEFLESAYRGAGSLLLILKQNGGAMKAGDLASLLHVSCARVSLLIKKLELLCYVTRYKDKNDYRVTYIKLTKKGEKRAEAKYEKVNEILDKIIAEVGEDHLIEYLETTKKINDIIKNNKEEGKC